MKSEQVQYPKNKGERKIASWNPFLQLAVSLRYKELEAKMNKT
jgi:hypothetical protein